MAQSCIIRPTSKLFDGLEKYYGSRDKAISIYGRLQDTNSFNAFLDSLGIPHSESDMEDGEYTLSFITNILGNLDVMDNY